MMNAISQLQLKSCNVLKGCLLLDLQCMREFVCNADRYVGAGINRSSSTNICLCCIIAILTLKDTKDCHDNKMFAASVHKILEIATMQIDDAARIARENEPFNMRGVSLMSLIAINMAIYRRVPPLESCANLFKALLSFVQACIIRFTKRGDHSETIMFRISLVTALDLIQAPAAVNKNTISYIGVINDIIQFCSVEANNDFLEPEVKENAMKLASCLVKLRCDNAASKVVLNGEFLVDWSLQTLSKVNSGCSECSNAMSALFIQFSLEVLDLAFLKAPTQSKRCDAEITKLFENVLRIGIITKLIWLLLHPDNVIQYLDRKVLSKLTGLIRSRRQQEKQGFVHTYIDDRNVAKLLLQQSVVQVSLYVKESIQNDSQGCQLLEQMTRGIYDIVISGDADSVIDQCTVALSPEATIISCTGLLLIASSPSRVESQELAFYSNDFVKELIKAVFDVSMSTRFEFVEISAVFWQAIEFIIARRENTEQEGTSMQDILTLGSREEPLFRAGMETTVIMFRSLIDDVETPMECPSLAELVQRVPGLAQEVRTYYFAFWMAIGCVEEESHILAVDM